MNVVDGSRVIDIQGYQFRIELIEGLTRTPPTASIATGFDTLWTHGSMWNELLYYVSREVGQVSHQKHSQLGDNWADYPQDDTANGLNISTGNGRYSWCKERHPTNLASRVVRGYLTVTSFFWTDYSYVHTNYGWRPALFLLQ